MGDLLAEHLQRHWAENSTEGWASCPEGTFEAKYSADARRKQVGEIGWCRLWTWYYDGKVVGHASLFDSGEPNLAYGHIGIEASYRGMGIARKLQVQRLSFCDEHQLSLAGPCSATNRHSYDGCLKMGFRHVGTDDNGDRWMLRLPAGLEWAWEGTV